MVGRCLAKDSHIIKKKNVTATTEISDPILAIKFQKRYMSGKSEYRRGIPAKPKKCIGKNVRLTPMNIVKN